MLFVTSLNARDIDVIIVRGADGAEEYGKKFTAQVEAWKAACAKGDATAEVIAGEESAAKLEKRLTATKAGRPLWLVLIGHGTFDGREAFTARRRAADLCARWPERAASSSRRRKVPTRSFMRALASISPRPSAD